MELLGLMYFKLEPTLSALLVREQGLGDGATPESECHSVAFSEWCSAVILCLGQRSKAHHQGIIIYHDSNETYICGEEFKPHDVH